MLIAPRDGARRPSSRHRRHHRRKLDSKALMSWMKEHDRLTVSAAVLISALLAAWLAGLAAG